MNTQSRVGGDGGGVVVTIASPSPPPTAEYNRALKTVRQATTSEIACLFNRQDRVTILKVQSGEPVAEWSVRAAASFLDHPPTEQGREAREGRDRLIIDIRKTHERLSVRPTPPEMIEIEQFPGEPRDEYEARCESIRSHVPEPDPVLVARHADHCSRYPWITFYLGYRTSPVPNLATASEPKQARDALTAMSVRKARERARTRTILIDPRWKASSETMYLDIITEIGICPPMVDVHGKRVYTLDRIVNKRGYVPGNIRWADKSQQTENRRLP